VTHPLAAGASDWVRRLLRAWDRDELARREPCITATEWHAATDIELPELAGTRGTKWRLVTGLLGTGQVGKHIALDIPNHRRQKSSIKCNLGKIDDNAPFRQHYSIGDLNASQ